MKEILEEVILENGEKTWSLRIEFDNDTEANLLFSQLRMGLPELMRETSKRWSEIEENNKELVNAFAQTWFLIQMARQSTDKVFVDTVKANPEFYRYFQTMASEAAKLMAVLVDSAGKTRARRQASAKDIRRRLLPVKNILMETAGEEFKLVPLDFFPAFKENRHPPKTHIHGPQCNHAH